ncbi:hypothetical protein NEMBOFW57_006895 [Staphylotrichum longicolle]|uniref:SH3 domain-containing protein n=1 Tax=Staphylotrichum longicolle TaxID=669026 RepID=A0AAD4ETR7_9PEZI|nr:hypothetical protein NEMBOFW57_006895 [Staphylotrichum longicolle]
MAAAQEWWDAVKHEVRDMLAPGHARRQNDEDPILSTTLLPEAVSAPATLTSIETEALALATTTRVSTTSRTLITQTPTTSTARPTATAAANEANNDGEMSVAAKAGIVIGVLAGILAVFVLIYCVFSMRRKKLARRRQQIEDDEKINGPFADSAAIRPPPKTPSKAPRLSLRPVTQFLPNFNAQGQAERRASRGIALTLNPVSNPTAGRPTGGSAWERPGMRSATTSPNGDHRPGTSASLHPHNPFHDNHRLPEEPVSPSARLAPLTTRRARHDDRLDPGAGIPHHRGRRERLRPPPRRQRQRQRQRPGLRTRLGVASSLTRKTSIRKDPQTPGPDQAALAAVRGAAEPRGTEYSMHSMAPGQFPGPSASAAAIAAAGGPQSTVHRVQLDFKPTLQDEMELRAGQLVRLLHEYDGWALCIRLDRSQQGVVPRTCLSTRPVKPRPQQGGNARGGPPVNPSYHHHHHHQQQQQQRQGSRSGRISPGVPPLPVAKDDGYGSGSDYGGFSSGGNGNGNGSGSGGAYGYGFGQRPRSPAGGNGGNGRRGNSPLGWGEPGQAY